MYAPYFNLSESPFSITPNPGYFYMSEHHREAFAHLFYGLRQDAGFVLLTGEVGAGKTTLCRCLMGSLPERVDVALILNPRISEREFLGVICDELHIEYPKSSTKQNRLDRLNKHLLQAHANGRQTVLLIDEAQTMSDKALEQVRLLTNLETAKHKLLQIILVGQPELIETLNKPGLYQLAQRITARYHLQPLPVSDVGGYIRHRIETAGNRERIFTGAAIRRVAQFSNGIPRLINIICDRSLLGAYADEKTKVTASMVRSAAKQISGRHRGGWHTRPLLYASVLAVVALLGVSVYYRVDPHGAGIVIENMQSKLTEWLASIPGIRSNADG
ncbi:MAG: AAA family ATPase [Gammaproteobacteria bacterium]|nr:AAA family ATPase [Gammaproteobacteria bacterium]